MRTPSKKTVAICAAVAVVAGGAVGGALAASGTFDPTQQRQAFLNDVAGRLGVTSSKLEDALKAAAIDRVDAALAAGQITQAQADALKAAINSGTRSVKPKAMMEGCRPAAATRRRCNRALVPATASTV